MATATKSTTAKARTAAKREPGPKPTYQIVENALHAQTSQGEIIISFDTITTKKIRGIVAVMDNELDSLNYLCEEVFPPEVDELPVTEGVPLMMRFMEDLGRMFGATLGEAQSSSTK